MLRFFSLNNSKADNVDSFHGGPRSTRGLRSGVVAGPSASQGTFGSVANSHGGRLSVVQGDNGDWCNVLGPRLTDEPASSTDTSGAGIGRGRRAPAEAAISSVYNGAQALALQACELKDDRGPSSGYSFQLASTTDPKVEQNEVPQPQYLYHHKVAREKPNIVYPRRYSPGKPQIVNARFPLRIGTHPPLIFDPTTNGGISPLRSHSIDENKVESPDAPKKSFTNALYNGSSKLSSTPSTPPTPLIASTASTLHVLAVGVAYGDIVDPEHDLNILHTMLKGSEPQKSRFKGISGEGATHEAIEQAIGELYREVLGCSNSNLLILITGEGDEDNRMCLIGGGFITDADLRRWMWKLQIECHPYNRTVTIILDHCRTKPIIPPRVSHVGVEFIWSCSPGQTAAALKFPSTQDIPRSCFLLALLMTSYNYSRNKGDIVTAVDHEVCKLLRFLKFAHNNSCPCRENKPCPKPYRPQDPDWLRAGSMKPIYDFLDILSKTDIASKVYGLLMRNKHFCEANGLPANGHTFEPRPSPQAGMTQHKRGSSKPVHATPNVQLGRREPPGDDNFLKNPERLQLKQHAGSAC